MRVVLTILLLACALCAQTAPTEPIDDTQYSLSAGAGWNHYANPRAQGWMKFSGRVTPNNYTYTRLNMTSLNATLVAGFERALVKQDGFTLLTGGDLGVIAGSKQVDTTEAAGETTKILPEQVGVAGSVSVNLLYDVSRWSRVPKTSLVFGVNILKTSISEVQPVFSFGIEKHF